MEKIKSFILSKKGMVWSLVFGVVLVGALVWAFWPTGNQVYPDPDQKVRLPEEVNPPVFSSVLAGEVGLGTIDVGIELSNQSVSIPLYLSLEVSRFSEVATKLGFSAEPNTYAGHGLMEWSALAGNKSLVINSENGDSVYSSTAVIPKVPEGLPPLPYMNTPEDATNATKVFLEKNGFNVKNIDFSFYPTTYLTGSGDELLTTTDFSQADLVVVRPVFILSGLPVLENDGRIDSWSVWMDKYFNVVKVEFNIRSYLEAEGNREVISPFAAVEKLKNGQGIVVYTDKGFSSGNLERTEITEVSLGYYPNEDSIMMPTYKLLTKGYLKDATAPIEMIVYLPGLLVR